MKTFKDSLDCSVFTVASVKGYEDYINSEKCLFWFFTKTIYKPLAIFRNGYVLGYIGT
jgi:hypothetical protein